MIRRQQPVTWLRSSVAHRPIYTGSVGHDAGAFDALIQAKYENTGSGLS
jgi:hypothetical protein